MKGTLLFFTVLTLSTSVFASSKDLKVFNVLLKAGVSSEQFMSQVHVGLDDIECAYSISSKKYDCNMVDISANEGTGGSLVLTGKKAESIFKVLEMNGAQSDNGMGKVFLSAKSIRCHQVVSGVADGSAADRTSCLFEISAE